MIKSGDEIRKAYLDFFESKDHLILDSAPLVPKNDPSLLWINAGMAPFKPYFDGSLEPPHTRIATSQKCIRTNDIEHVGKTARHHTFFEMLGNFSFGDYFKEEAVEWAWEFVTEVLNLEEEKLWITIYKDDDEAFNIWHDKIGIPKEKIVRMGKKDNFWQIGTGPCGPCSEIHYDRGEEYGNSEEDVIGGEGDRFLEIWNLVFTQYNFTEDGEYLNLPSKNIDTGMGLERVASILQDTDSNFETDLIKPIIDAAVEKTGIPYKENEEVMTAYRVIADHSRSVSVAVADGALPSNEGRGYVIRRLIRRASRYGRKLGFEEPFLYKLADTAAEVVKGISPNVADRIEHIKNVIKSEENSFLQTLEQGLEILETMVAELKEEGEDILSGEDAFRLYDTYGFPLDITRDLLNEQGLALDEEKFNEKMEEQRRRAREAREETSFSSGEMEKIYAEFKDKITEVEFTGYKSLSEKTEILGLVKDNDIKEKLSEGQEGELILNKTPFYAESGGQIGDKGAVKNDNFEAEVLDTYQRAGLTVHRIFVNAGEVSTGDKVEAVVYKDKRMAAARNHSATHLLHKALKDVLGDHVNQSGSLVAPERLRFDFTHFSAVSAEELRKIEAEVNQAVMENYAVETDIKELDEAKEMGATALFGEKYGEEVRVVSMGDFSMELCGGTHVDRTGDIGPFKITSESGIAAGVRRIEAVTGDYALDYFNYQLNLLDSAAAELKTDRSNLLNRIKQLQIKEKEMEKEIDSLKKRLASFKKDDLISRVKDADGVKLLAEEIEAMDNQGLRNISDQLKEKMDSGIIVLGSRDKNKVIFVASVTDDLVKEGYHAGKLIGEIAKIVGGGGGGRPDMAQAGGKNPEKLTEALAAAEELVKNMK
ncbi:MULTISPECIES: alanine--tRNA ligase [unclassified Halanaerobium]|uniref:alanine--tRNA ligase n=1 Tax=unclassified Halanaerobium TaxID=2641197 RepID=UPI000DF48092|nr:MULTISPECIES: alanine--tRNA ligase [unclassified Halanaerobium]RCW50495.1 alanyl-tRNA synthetase [Halanaerobium sp. MA284_MarDTE_T2]RCW85982.1 alanyl-tRNA synthetase [Halanaerobium sp. DL-01]